MRPKSERDLRSAYADLLTLEDDAATVALIGDLDAALQSVEPPPALWSSPPVKRPVQPVGAVPRRVRQTPLRLPDTVLDSLERLDRIHAAPPPKRRGWSIHTKLYLAFTCVLACLLAIAAGVTSAGPNQGDITNLGKPTNAIPQFNPASEFRHVKLDLRSHGLPEVLFIGTLVDEYSATERWPLVKALDQFGTWSGVTAAVTRSCYNVGSASPPKSAPEVQCWDAGKAPGDATYDLSHARYRSRYVAFLNVDLIDSNLHVKVHPTAQERTLFNQYVRTQIYRKWSDAVWQNALFGGGTVISHGVSATKGFPLLVVQSYLAAGTNVAIPGDLTPQNTSVPLPFSVVQQSLRDGKVSGNRETGAPPSLLQDYNAEANVITAFICHADGKKPASVCGRSVIKSILRHVR